MKIKWLGRRISAPGPYLCLCLSEVEFRAAMKHCRLDTVNPWVKSPQADATVHHAHSDHGQVAIVCMRDTRDRKPVEIAGLLVHESVHIWQEWCAYYGESDPGCEQEAYAIQSIAQELMAEFARRMEN
jgi:hypothetical protein